MTTLSHQRSTRAVLLAVLLLIPATVAAENAVEYTDAQVEAGDSFVIGMITSNDEVISGGLIPFRWSSPDIYLDSITIIRDRYRGEMQDRLLLFDSVAHTGGILFFPKISILNQGYIESGSGTIALIHFTVDPEAPDQVVRVDSVYQVQGESIIYQTQYSDFTGLRVIYPAVYPGLITIGTPPAEEALLRVSPDAFIFREQAPDGGRIVQTIDIEGNPELPVFWEAAWREDWITLSPAFGTTRTLATLEINLNGLEPGAYTDSLVFTSPAAVPQVIVPVIVTIDTLSSDSSGTTRSETLGQNRPNPFRLFRQPTTTITFSLPAAEPVSIRIYDLLGRQVRTLRVASPEPGGNTVEWDGRDVRGNLVPSGHYFYRLQTSSGVITRRMVVIK